MNKRKRRLGDRSDGRKLRSLEAITTLSAYLMAQRNDATNYFEDKFDIELAEKYVKEKRKAGLEKFGFMHLIVAAYVRTVSQKPGVNRFVSGQKIYARNDISVNIAVKKELSLNAEETMVKTYFTPEDSVEEIYRKFQSNLEATFGETESDFDGTARILNYIPGLVKRFVVGLLKFLDYFGLLPKFLLDVSPFHGSLVITSMASLGIPPVYHHLYNFGNVPVFLAFGTKEIVNELQADGSVKKRKYMPYKVSCDERICDGQYYSSAFKLIRRLMKNPYLLDEPFTVVEDID